MPRSWRRSDPETSNVLRQLCAVVVCFDGNWEGREEGGGGWEFYNGLALSTNTFESPLEGGVACGGGSDWHGHCFAASQVSFNGKVQKELRDVHLLLCGDSHHPACSRSSFTDATGGNSGFPFFFLLNRVVMFFLREIDTFFHTTRLTDGNLNEK